MIRVLYWAGFVTVIGWAAFSAYSALRL
jgi:hypothetical protein